MSARQQKKFFLRKVSPMALSIKREDYGDAPSSPDIKKDVISKMIGMDDALAKVKAYAISVFQRFTGFDPEDVKQTETELLAEQSRLQAEAEKIDKELEGTDEFVERPTDEPIAENATSFKLKIGLGLGLSAISAPMLVTTMAGIVTQSTRFEFIIEAPWKAILFIFPILLMVWVLAEKHDDMRTEGEQRNFRDLLNNITIYGFLCWSVCFVLVNVVGGSSDAFSAPSQVIETAFVLQLISQIFLEVTGGAAVKISLLKLYYGTFKTVQVINLPFEALKRRKLANETALNEVRGDLCIIRRHRSSHKASQDEYIAECEAYFNQLQKEQAAQNHASTTAAAAAAADHQLKMVVSN